VIDASDHLNRARRLFTAHVIRIPFEVRYLYDPESLFQTTIQLVVSIFVTLFFVEYIHFLLKPHQNNFLLESISNVLVKHAMGYSSSSFLVEQTKGTWKR
jgi:hypothetical protein